ncbi:MAG: flavin-dependent dehydrogenase [Candidatus Paceibacteria bacterium]|jgi:flavin-dependent dehydrogenase
MGTPQISTQQAASPATNGPLSGDRYDAIVLGGGPAGSSAATCLASEGHRVLVIESDRFPRFHVGESLLPMSNPILSRLGLDKALSGMGAVPKYGATFMTESGELSSRVDFEEAPHVHDPRSFHVVRAEFDHLLLQNARQAGAEVREECTVLDVDCERDFPRVRVRDSAGHQKLIEAKFLLDATGRRGVIAKQLGLRTADPELKKTALFAHFRGVPHPEGRAKGDIQIIVRSGGGWVWLIPMPDDHMSIGFVFDNSERPKELRESPGECLDRWIAGLTLLDAHRETLQRTSPARWEADFSYGTRAYHGDNWLLLGDSGSFLDPVFSSGVQLALVGGTEAADTVARALNQSRGARRRTLMRYDRAQRRRYKFFRRLVLGFYRPVFRELMFYPEAWPAGARALACMLAGQDRPGWITRIRVAALFMLVSLKERFAPQPQ